MPSSFAPACGGSLIQYRFIQSLVVVLTGNLAGSHGPPQPSPEAKKTYEHLRTNLGPQMSRGEAGPPFPPASPEKGPGGVRGGDVAQGPSRVC